MLTTMELIKFQTESSKTKHVSAPDNTNSVAPRTGRHELATG